MSKSGVHRELRSPGPSWVGRLGVRAVIAVLAVASVCLPAAAQVNQLPAPARGVDIEEHLGRILPMDLQFTNAQGEMVSVGGYFGKGEVGAGPTTPKATIVALVYYGCPVACSAVMDKLAECLDKLDYTVGKDFNCLLFSFNPEEGTPLAAGRKTRYLAEYNKPVDAKVRAGWEFHTGTESANRELADAFGFPYRKQPDGQYSHSIGIFVVSPEGKIVRYIYGFDYPPAQVKLALLEASEGKMAKSIGDRFAGVCFLWDGSAGKYTFRVMRLVQIGGALTLVLLTALIGGFLVYERVRRRRRATEAAGTAGTAGHGPRAATGGHSIVTLSGAQTG